MTGEKTVGILGGMGPLATVDLFAKIVKSTDAACDQDHLRIVIDSNAKIPDRSAFLFGRGPDPTEALVRTAQNVEKMGADFIAIPCNTSHYFYPAISGAVSIPVLHIMEEVSKDLKDKVSVVGLLASSGTVYTKLYDAYLNKVGIKVLNPCEKNQQQVMDAIYEVKGGNLEEAKKIAISVGERLIEKGAQAVLAGCTEIPLILQDADLEVPVLDATMILARSCVFLAKH